MEKETHCQGARFGNLALSLSMRLLLANHGMRYDQSAMTQNLLNFWKIFEKAKKGTKSNTNFWSSNIEFSRISMKTHPAVLSGKLGDMTISLPPGLDSHPSKCYAPFYYCPGQSEAREGGSLCLSHPRRKQSTFVNIASPLQTNPGAGGRS